MRSVVAVLRDAGPAKDRNDGMEATSHVNVNVNVNNVRRPGLRVLLSVTHCLLVAWLVGTGRDGAGAAPAPSHACMRG